ncbi:uncharacterized protein IUM83_07745 [Phytophthora cinnamomi]|uniref:uncharacterized protein n=1 Tax=Phytophthora cinnamomi TaxID=4785 RepID=UPI0035594E28|nr:hypothetical protein IUM83_07745 [Phytophthora cinnamomi]
MLHKCLTAVFTSDDTLGEEEIRACQAHFKSAHARRGILQVATQYYHYVEDKHSGIGFAKKEYLVTPLRLLPICRSLDLWQHAFTCDIDAANQADPTESDEEAVETVGDELFFSVIGSLMYDMLNFEVPLQKVLTFVTVMCSTYQKGQDLLDTLKQLAENVYRALDMSKDIKPSPPKDAVQHRINPKPIANHTGAPSSSTELPPKPASRTGGSLSASGMIFAESPMLSREYDLNTVFNDMKVMHENREAALHSEYQTRIETLERELEIARAAAQSTSSSSPDQDTSTMHLASYTALCSLVDTVCSDEDGGKPHPSITDFQDEKDVLEYVAGLYTKLKEALLAQQQQQQEQYGKTIPVDLHPATTSQNPASLDEGDAPGEFIRTAAPPSSSRRPRNIIKLSPEQETEFRAVARHLISTRALDSFVVSSSDEEA